MASWELNIDDKEDLSEVDLAHIADMIQRGFTSGELVDDEDEE